MTAMALRCTPTAMALRRPWHSDALRRPWHSDSHGTPMHSDGHGTGAASQQRVADRSRSRTASSLPCTVACRHMPWAVWAGRRSGRACRQKTTPSEWWSSSCRSIEAGGSILGDLGRGGTTAELGLPWLAPRGHLVHDHGKTECIDLLIIEVQPTCIERTTVTQQRCNSTPGGDAASTIHGLSPSRSVLPRLATDGTRVAEWCDRPGRHLLMPHYSPDAGFMSSGAMKRTVPTWPVSSIFSVDLWMKNRTCPSTTHDPNECKHSKLF